MFRPQTAAHLPRRWRLGFSAPNRSRWSQHKSSIFSKAVNFLDNEDTLVGGVVVGERNLLCDPGD